MKALILRRAASYYTQTKPDQYGYVGDPEGQAFVDLGLGGFLRSPENGNDAWRALATKFDGRFRTVTARQSSRIKWYTKAIW